MVLLEELSQEQVAALNFASTIFILPLSPLERHGPHLPVGTDLFMSSALARACGEQIEQRWPGIRVVVGPLVPLGAQAVPGPGSVSTGQRALHDTLFDFIRSLKRTGFRSILICSVHGSIGHIVAQEEVAERCLKELGVRVEPLISAVIIPFLTGRYLSAIEQKLTRPLTEEERKALLSDCHGGQWETGVMLTLRPDLVDEKYLSLPPVLFRSWLQLGRCMADSCARGLGYVGAPGFATTDYARAAEEVLRDRMIERVGSMINARRFRPSHTIFYHWPPYRTRPAYPRGGLAGKLASTFLAGTALGLGAGILGSWLARKIPAPQEAAHLPSMGPDLSQEPGPAPEHQDFIRASPSIPISPSVSVRPGATPLESDTAASIIEESP